MYERKWEIIHFEMEKLVWTGMILSVFLPLILFSLLQMREHHSQKSQRTFLIESNDLISQSCILSEILLHVSQGIKWLNPLEKGPEAPAVPENLEIKNQEDKLVVQYFLSKDISLWTTRAHIQKDRKWIAFLVV